MPLKPPDRFELDEQEPLQSTYHDVDTNSENSAEHEPVSAWQKQSKSWRLSRSGCILIALFVTGLALVLGFSGSWKAPQAQPSEDYTGRSEAWYPTPQGGADAAWQESYSKAARLVSQMTLVEKVNITTGTGWQMGMCVGNTAPVPRFSFPSLCLQDGPLGLRFTHNTTAFPAGITVGATWNKRLMRMRGEAQGFEARMKGVNVLLGPSMGPIGRLPAGGRNWEGFGADPVLQGIAAAEIIKGVQSQGVIATAKHWLGNEQEHFRQAGEWGNAEAISSNIDDRTLHEIYAWPFADSIRAGVGSVMCSYNSVNSSYSCENSKLLNGLLKDELGFQGFVQSDWLAQRSGVASALAGLDMTMPGDGLGWEDGKSLWGKELTRAVLNTSIPIERFNDMALRVVAAWYQMGQDDELKWKDGPNFSSWTNETYGRLHSGSADDKSSEVVNKFADVRNTVEGGNHDQLVRRIAAEGIVMVKNDILPLKRDGGGISKKGMELKVGIFGEDAFLNPAGDNACEDRECNVGTLAMGWGSGAVNLAYLSEPAAALSSAFDSSKVELSYIKTNDDPSTESTAREQDVCIVFINSDAGEGFLRWEDVRGDRNNLSPQKDGDDLIKRVASYCDKTIVVLHTVGPTILEEWIDLPAVKAVLIAHLPGQESGNALADIIFGILPASGHLPYTIARREEDYGPHSRILTESNEPVPQQSFEEGLYIDYRHFDKHDIEPRFPFGFGLSYTTFTLSNVSITSTGINDTLPKKRDYYKIKPPKLDHLLPDPQEAVVPQGFTRLQRYIYPYLDSADEVKQGQYDWPAGYSTWHAPSPAGGAQGGNPDLWTTAVKLGVDVSNTGEVNGDAVVQVYVSMPDHVLDNAGSVVDMPVRVLRAFDKVSLTPSGADKKKHIQFELTRRDLSYWDVHLQNWVMPYGDYKLCIGFSSRDLPECHQWSYVKNTTMPTQGSTSLASMASTSFAGAASPMLPTSSFI